MSTTAKRRPEIQAGIDQARAEMTDWVGRLLNGEAQTESEALRLLVARASRVEPRDDADPPNDVDGWCRRCDRAATWRCGREHGAAVVPHEEGA